MVRARIPTVALASVLSALACGERFVEVEDPGVKDDSAAGGSSRSSGGRSSDGGRPSTGGVAATGGARTSGGTSGGGDGGGGGLASGGTSTGGETIQPGGSGGSGGSASGGFGGESALFADDFEREALGTDWAESPKFHIQDGQLACTDCVIPLVTEVRAGVPLEGSVALSAFPVAANEVNLIILAQNGLGCDALELSYSPVTQVVHLYGCWDGNWTDFGEVAASIAPGSRLGARVEEFPLIQVLVDNGFVGQVSAQGYPFQEGAFGVGGVGDSEFRFDDFHAQAL